MDAPEAITFNENDYVVEHGIIFQVIGIKEKENFKGEMETFITYKPFFQNPRTQGLIRSTPLSSLGLTSLRKPIEKDQVDEIFDLIKTLPAPGAQLNQKTARDVLNSNAIIKIAEIIQMIRAEQLDEDKSLSLTKREILTDATKRISQEISVVLEVDIEEAENMINKCLMAMDEKN